MIEGGTHVADPDNNLQTAKRRKHQLRTEQSMLASGSRCEPGIKGNSTHNKRSCLGRPDEKSRHPQERIEIVPRHKKAKRRSRMGKQGKSSSPGGLGRSKQKDRRDRAVEVLAATKIQRAYRVHRAIEILNELEHRILGAFDPPNDARTALTYLRARSAELAALRPFMSATPHISDNLRAMNTLQRVSDTLQSSIERAKREQEDRELGSVVVHVREVDRGSEYDNGSAFPNVVFDSNRKPNNKRRASIPELPDIAEEGFNLDSNSRSPEDDSEGYKAVMDNILSVPTQRKEWVRKIIAVTPRRRARRHPTVSKVPTLLTIPEVPETGA